ncbi:MAG TPA: substrate-binding domain-containing protein, partial [Bacteroidales bacterium]|nr:substrate-binding domain-containing protein [Bacteroidales bacterium]
MKWIFRASVLLLLVLSGCGNHNSGDEIIIFHAGSLSVPLRQLKEAYEKKNPDVSILLEPSGSLVCARKVTELKKPCDIVASADYTVIDKML